VPFPVRVLFAFHAALDSLKSKTKGANKGRASFDCERVCTIVNNDWMLFGHYFAKESIFCVIFWKSAHRIATNLFAAAALGLAVFMTSSSLARGSTFGGFGWHYTLGGYFFVLYLCYLILDCLI
jgi:hypothetical protein